MTYNDEGEVAGAVVMMLKGANSNDVIKNVKERIALIEKTLPEGVIIEPFLDRTKWSIMPSTPSKPIWQKVH
jgi:cobalt-zinc-cadmium resistance protein CzcA